MKLHLPLTYLRIVVAIAVSFLLSSSFTVYGQACQFQQGQNGGVGLPVESPVQFERGNSNGSKSHFAEGYSVPYRIEFTTLEANQQYRVRIAFDVKKNEKVSFDYITGFQNLQLRQSLPSELVDPLVGTGLASLSGISSSFLAIPAPTFTTNTSFNSTASASFSQLKTAAGLNPETSMPTSPYSASLRNKGNMVIWNATLNSIQYVGGVDISPATVSVAMDVVFTKANNANNVVLAWGGHIASLLDWGVGNSASSIPGSPYHMYVETVVKTSDGDVICNGNMDCQIAADAVTPVPTCNITGPSELCSSTTLVNYKAVLDASQNGPVSYNWSVVDLSSSSTAQLSGSVAGVSSIDTLLQAIIPSDSFLVRLRVQRGGIFNYCYLNSVDSPGTKVKKLNVEVQAQAMPTVISLNSASTSQLNATIQLNGSIVTTGFNYQWTIVGPGGFASGSLDSYSIPDPVFTASMAGDYTLKVIASQQAAPNCVDSATIVISVGSSQGCPSLLTQSLCNASQLSFPVSSLPQPDVDYSWSVTNGASILNEGGDSLLTVLAGAQDFDITLQLSYANPLLNNLVCTYPVIVHPLPIVTAGSYGPTCVTASPLSLSGLPAGGTWSGSGVSGSTFTPSVAGAGTIRVYYSYTDENGCSSVDSTEIVVNDIPQLDPGTYGPLCVSASSISLSGLPAGGTWSGTGVSGSTFDPSVAGVGTHAVNYSVTITGGCVTDTTIDIEVKPLPNLDLGTYEPLCEEDEIITLTATPTGGTWSGTGTNGSTFNPALAGLGVHVLTYHYTDAFGCSAVQEVSIQVNRCAGINACTLTQGYYGSTNGNSCDEDSLYRNAVSIIKKLLTPSPIVIGSGARTLTITVADSARLNAVMPGGGTPFSFSHTGNITLQSSQFSLYKTSRGKINNILLSQTIALALNVRIKPDLAPFVLENGYIHTQRLRTCQNADLPSLVTCEEDSMAIRAWLMIPSVVNYLLANSGGTVADLLALANEVLGRTKVPGQAGAGGTVVPSLANIVAQVDIINNAFDQCRIFLGFFPTLNLCTSSSLRAAQQEEAQVSVVIKTLEVKVFPNPFGTTLNFNIQTPEKTKVTIELFDLQGKLLTQEYIGEFQSQENRIIQMKAPVVSAPILYRVTTSKKVFSGVLLPSR